MIITILNIIVALLALISLIAVIYFFGRAFSSKMRASKEKYGVGEFDMLRSMKLDVMRGIGAAIIGLIFLGVFGVMPRPSDSDTADSVDVPAPTATAVIEITPSPTVTAIVVPTMAPGTAVIFPTSTPDAATTPLSPAAPTAIPTIAPATATAAPAETTAVVSSGVGVWLRDAPTINSNQLEWLLEGVVLTVLDGRETADDLDWQEVRTAEGVSGWVAADYIEINGG